MAWRVQAVGLTIERINRWSVVKIKMVEGELGELASLKGCAD